MIPELIDTFQYPLSGLPIRLFRNPETREGILVGCEVAALMEYSSMSFLRKGGEYQENIHFLVLRRDRLKKFKRHLESKNIRIYLHSRSLLLLTETGIAFLLGKYCKEQAMRAGEWLVSQAFPNLRPHRGVHCQKISSRYLNREIFIFTHQGRFAMSAPQMFSLMGLPSLDQLSKGVNAYIPNIHLGVVSPLDPDCIFYESGLYRYWSHVRHPLVPLMKKAFEKEIWPQFRRVPCPSPSLSTETFKNRQSENIRAMEGSTSYLNTGERLAKLEELQKMVKQLHVATGKGFENLQKTLIDELSRHKHLLQECMGQRGKIGPLTRTKELARSLGLYYLDKVTPHMVFTRALVEYAQSSEKDRLLLILETKLQIRPGENTVTLLQSTYKVWKSP